MRKIPGISRSCLVAEAQWCSRALGGEANIWLSLEECSLEKKTMLGDGVSLEYLDTSFYVSDGLV